MKPLLLLLLVYTNMGFTVADKIDQPDILPAIGPESLEPQGIIVSAPDNCRIIFR